MKNLNKYLPRLLAVCMLWACHKDKVTPNYEIIDLKTGVNLRGVQLVDAQHIYIGGGEQWETGLLWHTQNGGETWQTDTLQAQGVQALEVFDNSVIVGTTTGRFFTQNEAKNWEYAQTNVPNYGWTALLGVAQTEDSTLYAVTGSGYFWGAIAHSINKGATWHYTLTERQLFDIKMLNTQKGFACGFGAIFSTENAGATWEILDIKGDIFKAMSFVDTQTGFVVGDEGGIWRTLDGGATFEVLRKPNTVFNKQLHWNDVHFLNKNEGWIVGENAVWRTQNSGRDWEIVANLPACSYRAVCAISFEQALLVGNDGCVVWVK